MSSIQTSTFSNTPNITTKREQIGAKKEHSKDRKKVQVRIPQALCKKNHKESAWLKAEKDRARSLHNLTLAKSIYS